MTGTTESTKESPTWRKILHDRRDKLNKIGEYNKVQEDQNHGKAVATGFHGDSTEQEVEQLLRETIAEIGMLTENVKIKCPAKPITYAFIYTYQ